MRNPEHTKETILIKSGNLFNVKGYKATSLSDITEATGLTKGAIYKHFKNKECLEEESFDKMAALIIQTLSVRIKAEANGPDKLRAIIKFYETYVNNPVIDGGCPLLNTAVESDDSNPALRTKSLALLKTLEDSLKHIIKKGIEHKQFKPDTDLQEFSSLFIATLEGAIMMSRLRGNNADMKIAVKHLNSIIKELEV